MRSFPFLALLYHISDKQPIGKYYICFIKENVHISISSSRNGNADRGGSLIVYKLLDIGSTALDDLVNEQIFDLAEEIIPMPFLSLKLDLLETSRIVLTRYPDVNKKLLLSESWIMELYETILGSSQGFEYCQSNRDIKFGSYDEKTPRDTTQNGILNPVGRSGS